MNYPIWYQGHTRFVERERSDLGKRRAKPVETRREKAIFRDAAASRGPDRTPRKKLGLPRGVCESNFGVHHFAA
jgi:hypothetical protein